MIESSKQKCFGCKALVPDIERPTHPYIGASPGCWKIYGDILAREYENRDYWPAHRLTVDAYAIQHPGEEERRSIQSVHAHLSSLYLIFKKKFAPDFATKVLGNFIKAKSGSFIWLEPPKDKGSILVTDVHTAQNAKEHCKLVYDWAQAAFEAWIEHHQFIRDIVDEYLSTSKRR